MCASGWCCPSSGWSSRARLRPRRAPTPTSSGPTPRSSAGLDRRPRRHDRVGPRRQRAVADGAVDGDRLHPGERQRPGRRGGRARATSRCAAARTSPRSRAGATSAPATRGRSTPSCAPGRRSWRERHLAGRRRPDVAVDDLHRVADAGRARRPAPAPHAPGQRGEHDELHLRGVRRGPHRHGAAARRRSRRPTHAVAGDQPVVGVHRDAGRRVRVPPREGRDDRLRLGRLRERPRATTSPAPGDGTYTFRVRALDDLGAPGPDASSTYVLDRVAPERPDDRLRPARPVEQPDRHVVVHGRGRRAALLPPDARRDRRLGLDALHEPAVLQPRRRGGRPLHLRGLLHRHGRQRRGDRDRHVHARPRRPGGADAHEHARRRRPTARRRRGPSRTRRARRRPAASSAARPSSATGPPARARKAFDLTSQADGTYTFRVLATDAAGNPGAEQTGTYVLDNAAPAAPTITAGPTGSSQNASPSYSFTGEAGASFECRISRGATVVSDWAPCVSPRSYALALEADGIYTFRVRATDAALNTGPDATRVYTLDRAAPAAPVDRLRPGRRVLGRHADLRLHVRARRRRTSAASSAARRWSATGRPARRRTPPTSPPSSTASTRSSCARSTRPATRAPDDAGHLHARPQRARAADDHRRPDRRHEQRDGQLHLHGRRRRDHQCRMERGATVVSDWAACTSPRSYDLSGEVDGTYTFRVRALDGATNIGGDSSRSFALDRVNPVAPTITSVAARRRATRPRRAGPSPARPGRARRVPHPARRDRRQRLGAVREPEELRPGRRGRRHLHVPRPLDRRRGQHRAPTRPAATSSTAPRRPRRRSPAARPATRRPPRPPTRSPARPGRRSSAACSAARR